MLNTRMFAIHYNQRTLQISRCRSLERVGKPACLHKRNT